MNDAAHRQHPPSHSPLSGIRVVDLSRYLPGPFCSLQLAWLGAHVTVVEQPPHGDPLRAFAPHGPDGVSLAYRSLRRDMQVELLDLADVDGDRARVLELVDGADVFIESFRPGVASRLGLGAEVLRERNPGLVYCSISGYGQDGPWAQAPGHDNGYEAAAGLLEQSGTADQVTLPPVPLADLSGGLIASTAICAALVRRASSGDGCVLDVSLTESALALQAMQLPGAGVQPGVDRGEGLLTGGLASYRPYRCSDGRWLAVGPIEPKFFQALCARIGREDLVEQHSDLAPGAQARLRRELEAVFAARPSAEWEQLLVGDDGGDACVVVARHPSEVAAHPQLAARGAVLEVPGAPSAQMPASPYVVDGVRSGGSGQR